MPEIATIGKSGMRSRMMAMMSKPLVPCRKMSTIARSNTEFSNSLQSGSAVGGLDRFIMVEPQHDGDHRADVGLIVDNQNARHRDFSGGFGRIVRIIRLARKDGVTPDLLLVLQAIKDYVT